jgi:hypothetical protein
MTLHLGFSIAKRKSIFFLNSKLLKKIYGEVVSLLILWLKNLGIFLLFYDECQMNIPNPTVDIEKYNQYKYSYLTNKDTEELSTEDIFIRKLKEL